MMLPSGWVRRGGAVAFAVAISVAVAGVSARADAGAGAGPLVRMAPLVAAMQRGDLDEVARLGGEVGAAVLDPALGSADRVVALTAVAAVRSRRALWALPRLATLAGSRDRRRALAAAEAALEIVVALDVEAQAAADLDSGAMMQWQRGWLALAQRPQRWIDTRVASLEVAARLGAASAEAGGANALAAGGATWTALLADPDPAMRRAVIEVTPGGVPAAARAALAKLVREEPEEAVALAAAALLCGELVGRDAAVLAELEDAGVQRLRVMAAATAVATAPDVELARCLRADGQRESQAALRSLVRAAKGQVQRALRSVERGGR